MSQITDEQVKDGAAAIYGTGSINGRAVTMSLDDALVTARLVLTAALSTLPVGAETGEPVSRGIQGMRAISALIDEQGHAKNCLVIHFDHEVTDADRQNIVAAHNAALAAPPRSDKANGEDWSSDVTPEAVQIMRSAAAPYLAGADLEQVDGHRSTYGAMGKIDHSMLPKEGSTVIPTDRLNRVAFVGSEATAEEVRSMASEILEWRKS